MSDDNQAMELISSVNETSNLQDQLEDLIQEKSERGSGSFGYMVLNSVVQENYDRAMAELKSVTKGLDNYPDFGKQAQRFITHAKSLVNAIKTKRSISGSPHVNKARKKELTEKITEHFIELRRCIVTIEKMEKRVRVADLSSTIIFFKAVFGSLVAITVALFWIWVYPEFSDIIVFETQRFFTYLDKLLF